jgi:hypothetical protein
VESRRDRLQALGGATNLDGLERTPELLQGEREQAVVGSDKQVLRGGGAHGDRSPRVCADGADLGIDDGEVHAGGHVGEGAEECQRAGTNVMAGDRVGDVDHARRRAAASDHAVADADELIVESVVREERQQR